MHYSNFIQTIESLVDFDDAKTIGVETIEYPYCLLIEISDDKNYIFDGIDLTGQKVFFQIDSELLKTDSLTKQGGGHIDVEPFKDKTALTAILKKYKASNTFYGILLGLKEFIGNNIVFGGFRNSQNLSTGN